MQTLFKHGDPCYTVNNDRQRRDRTVRFRKPKEPGYDAALQTPVIRASICTGEKTAGFLEQGGTFREVMLIRSQKDLDEFRAQYGIEGPIKTIY